MADAIRDPGNDRDRLAPWCPAILEASVATEVDPYIGAGIALTETEAGWSPLYSPKGAPDGVGDYGHGHGIFQVDDRSHPRFLANPEWRDIRAQALYALGLVADDYEYFRRSFPHAPESLIWDAALAAYNAGRSRVHRCLSIGVRPDTVTKRGCYAATVQRRANDLRAAHPHLFTPKPMEAA